MQATAAPAKDRAAAARQAIAGHLIAAADLAFRLGCAQLGRDIYDLAAYVPVMTASTSELAELARITGH